MNMQKKPLSTFENQKARQRKKIHGKVFITIKKAVPSLNKQHQKIKKKNNKSGPKLEHKLQIVPFLGIKSESSQGQF